MNQSTIYQKNTISLAARLKELDAKMENQRTKCQKESASS